MSDEGTICIPCSIERADPDVVVFRDECVLEAAQRDRAGCPLVTDLSNTRCRSPEPVPAKIRFGKLGGQTSTADDSPGSRSCGRASEEGRAARALMRRHLGRLAAVGRPDRARLRAGSKGPPALTSSAIWGEHSDTSNNKGSESRMSTPIAGASVWEQEVFDYVSGHVVTEGAILQEYQEFAADPSGSAAFRYLAGLILADERRHHQLFNDLAESIRQMGELRSPTTSRFLRCAA
jgi:hypothetical protein